MNEWITFLLTQETIWFGLLSVVCLSLLLFVVKQTQKNHVEMRMLLMQTTTSHYDSITAQLSVMQDRQLSSERHIQGLLGKLNANQVTAIGSLKTHMSEKLSNLSEDTLGKINTLLKEQLTQNADIKLFLDEALSKQSSQIESLGKNQMQQQHEMLVTQMSSVSRELHQSLKQQTEQVDTRLKALSENTDKRLQDIAGNVEQRLSEGFEKTTDVFRQVLAHLTRIDEAQKKITELSGNVVSLQEILADKRSRGAFGEVQLQALIGNLLPEQNYELQATLSNGKRVDCLLKLPSPSGNIAIDSKFPLESYQNLMNDSLPDDERQRARQQFKRDVKKHINDIAAKYLIAGETADGAVMFIPAEAIFAEIHAYYPGLVEYAHQARVWITSPTTIMAILTTARSVIKDEKTREQVHVIQVHLQKLSKDFNLFQGRMDKLAKHIQMANRDVEEVNISARRISGRFDQIERVELDSPD